MGFVDFFLKASRNCRVASQHEFRCRVLCDVSNGLPSSPPVKKVHANSPSLRPGHIHLLKRARFLDSRTPGPIYFVPGFPAQFGRATSGVPAARPSLLAWLVAGGWRRRARSALCGEQTCMLKFKACICRFASTSSCASL